VVESLKYTNKDKLEMKQINGISKSHGICTNDSSHTSTACVSASMHESYQGSCFSHIPYYSWHAFNNCQLLMHTAIGSMLAGLLHEHFFKTLLSPKPMFNPCNILIALVPVNFSVLKHNKVCYLCSLQMIKIMQI
jgi:hypothetical protein